MHALFAGLYTLASAVMALHFKVLAEKQGGCPLPMLIGEPETGMILCLTSSSMVTFMQCHVCILLGKSTAAKCALSLFGQQNSGHIMKTQATSDSICTERTVHSTLPFVLDDPKSPDDIGEMLITIYDAADCQENSERACAGLDLFPFFPVTLE